MKPLDLMLDLKFEKFEKLRGELRRLRLGRRKGNKAGWVDVRRQVRWT